ncbi:hypothetical protein AGMMS50267_10240 [Spirochaetia bacterium]|nr:hypothetical protein AGMMS50267_10240 [Spirochaetia bacterium]
MASKKEALFSPLGIFILYMLGSGIVIMVFRSFFPASPAPLAIFSSSWRSTLGLLDCIGLFPALAMSALVIPFGLKTNEEETFGRFSPNFLDRLKWPIIIAIVTVLLYGVLFFLALPLTRNARSDMEFRGKLFHQSLGKALEAGERGEWDEAARFVAVCERIWPDSPDLELQRRAVDRELDSYNFTHDDDTGALYEYVPDTRTGKADPNLREPLNVSEALLAAEKALKEERYYDAHWLATLADRLARPGSSDRAAAARLTSQAWNAITVQQPDSLERRRLDRYRLKQSGYEALVSEDWIRAYYIFRELSRQMLPGTPQDPDVENFLAKSQAGTLEVAFFYDELDMILGDILTGAVFSIPRTNALGRNDGRIVLRVGSLSTFDDYAYGFDIELVIFDQQGQIFNRLEAPYAKFLPKTLGSSPRVVLLLQVIDRSDSNLRWGPVWSEPDRTEMGAAEVILDLSYDEFLLMSQVRRGLDNFLVPELFTAEKILPPYGYIPQVFRAEIISRIAEPVFLLPMLILVILIGWRYRAPHRPRYLSIPMLAILPLVFNGLIHIYRTMINTLGIWAALRLSFTAAMFIMAGIVLVLFILSLILLVAQRD